MPDNNIKLMAGRKFELKFFKVNNSNKAAKTNNPMGK